jgi:lipopolysaccharide transport system permease protein
MNPNVYNRCVPVNPLSRTIAYEPHTLGNAAGWRRAFRDVWQARELTLRLLQRDLSGRHRQSILGWTWALLPSLGTMLLFLYLRNQNFIQVREPDGMPYPAYVLFAFAIWQMFAAGVIATTNSLATAGYFVSKVNFPRESLVLASFGTVLFDSVIRAVLVAIVFVWLRVPVEWTVVFLPFLLIPMFLLVLGLGFILSILHALFRDIGSSITMLLGLMLFLVPVIYPPPKTWPQVLVNDLNPVSAILIASHDLVVVGFLTRPTGLAIALFSSILVFAAGWRIFRLAQPIISERI